MQEESAPVGLDWLSASPGHVLKCLDLGKIRIDLAVFFPNTLVEPESVDMQRLQMVNENSHENVDVEARKCARGVSTCGSRLVVCKPWTHFETP